jgi:hypothetical protein
VTPSRHARADTRADSYENFSRVLLVATSRDHGNRPTRVLTGRRRPLGRGSHLACVANDIAPGLCGSHHPRWSRLPDGRLPLPQELHKLGAARRSLVVRTKTRCVAPAAAGRRRGCSLSWHENPSGRNRRSGRVLALTGHRGFLLWRTRSGTPVWTMGFEPVLFRWRPLRLARVRRERESVCVVRPLVLHLHRSTTGYRR